MYLKLFFRSDFRTDADPAALTKYVLALIKKDMPLEKLKELMREQMQVFLEAATPEFLSLLFDALETKSYLKETATTTTVDHKVWNESHFLCLKAFSNLHKCHYVNAMDYPERLCTINLFCCHTVPQETILNFGKLTF